MSELPPQGRSRETKIRRDARGRWWNDGVEITHAGLQSAFDAWLERAEDGRFCLKNDINWAYVTIEGPAFFVRDARLEPSADPPRVLVALSSGREEALDPATLREGPDGVLYADVLGGTMACAFDARAMVSLAPWLDEDEGGSFLRLGPLHARIARVEDPLAAHREATTAKRDAKATTERVS